MAGGLTQDNDFPRWPFLDPNAVLNGYRIERMLATQTSAGFAYEATELSTDARVAVKLLPRYLSRDPVFRERVLARYAD